MKGGLRPTTKPVWGGLPHLVRTFFACGLTASNAFNFFLVWPLPGAKGGGKTAYQMLGRSVNRLAIILS